MDEATSLKVFLLSFRGALPLQRLRDFCALTVGIEIHENTSNAVRATACRTLYVSMYVFIYIYTHTHIYIYIYICGINYNGTV